MRRKKILRFGLVVILVLAVVIYFCNKSINDAAEGRLYSDLTSVPFNKVGLLLGTAKYVSNHQINPYYSYRIDAAFKLIKADKIKYLIISGDNSRKDYDEPTQMRADLIGMGVDSNILFLDFAGFRTFDSIVRARDVFGKKSITVISQKFHNQRAIYIASKEKISAIGFNATDVSPSLGLRVQVREKLARVKVFVDYLFGTKPRFLGPKITISD